MTYQRIETNSMKQYEIDADIFYTGIANTNSSVTTMLFLAKYPFQLFSILKLCTLNITFS